MTETFPSVIDSTMRSSFVDCPQKFYRSFIQGLTPSEGSVHLVAGAAFARGCEVVRKLVWGDGHDLESALAEGIIAALDEYGDFECPDKINKTPERVCEALVEYFSEYPPATDHIQPFFHDDKPAVEFSFAIPLDIAHPETGEPILYAGRFDCIGQYQNGLWVVDEKSTSQLGASWLKNWHLRSQITGYCWAARQFGIPVNGAIIRGISFLKKSFGHAEAIEFRPDWMIDRWYFQLHMDITRMVECWNNGYWDFALDHACASYGGCTFQRLCTVNNPEQWVSQYYHVRRWSPLDRNPGGQHDQPILAT